jgi:hypothetical protein
MRAAMACVLLAVSVMTGAEVSHPAEPDESKARELFVDICTSCHTLERVKVQALNKEEWAGLIKGMVSEGAAVTDEEMDLIVGYLARHYGDGGEKK